MKKAKKFLKIFLAAFSALAVVMLTLLISAVIAGINYTDKNIEYQNNRLEYLKNEYYTEGYVPCDEEALAAFDLEKAYEDGVKYNEVAFLGTHNSYQLLATKQKRTLMKAVEIVTFGLVDYTKAVFEMDTLTTQLEKGVRNLEIDIETQLDGSEVGFIVTHDHILDNVSSCYNFEKALEEIALWSENNPGHLPVSLLIEPKNVKNSSDNIKSFSLEYADEFDAIVRNTLGDKLLTPADMLGNYESFEQMRVADGWATLEEMRGKIILLLHPCNATEDYINIDTSIKTQAMFPMLRPEEADKSYASFILDNEPEQASENNKETVDKYNLIVRTRADSYPRFSDERYAAADKCGSHIITTDYPPRTVRLDEHTYTFGGYTVKMRGN